MLRWEIDTEDERTLDNWVQKLNLTCESRQKIGWIGSAIFFGWITTLLVLPRLADLYGRILIWRIGLCVQLLAFSIAMVTESIDVMIAAMMLVGASATARVQVSFMVLLENLPSNKHAVFGSTIFVVETLIGISSVTYFTFISKNWFWLVLVGYIMEAIATVGSFLISETPKYLMKAGRTADFEVLLKRIAGWNGVPQVAGGEYGVDI